MKLSEINALEAIRLRELAMDIAQIYDATSSEQGKAYIDIALLALAKAQVCIANAAASDFTVYENTEANAKKIGWLRHEEYCQGDKSAKYVVHNYSGHVLSSLNCVKCLQDHFKCDKGLVFALWKNRLTEIL